MVYFLFIINFYLFLILINFLFILKFSFIYFLGRVSPKATFVTSREEEGVVSVEAGISSPQFTVYSF